MRLLGVFWIASIINTVATHQMMMLLLLLLLLLLMMMMMMSCHQHEYSCQKLM